MDKHFIKEDIQTANKHRIGDFIGYTHKNAVQYCYSRPIQWSVTIRPPLVGLVSVISYKVARQLCSPCLGSLMCLRVSGCQLRLSGHVTLYCS